MATVDTYGKLLIVGKDGKDHACDIRIVNKEISRKHAELYTEGNGSVFINSMGREPVSVNGAPVVSPVELMTGDKIEVHLEGRTRIFYFHSNGTVQVAGRKPLENLNAASMKVTSPVKPAMSPSAKKNDNEAMPPPPPPQDNAQKAVDEPVAAAEAAVQEEEMPMAIATEEPIAPIAEIQQEEEPVTEATAAPAPAMEKTEKLPVFEEMQQEDEEPLIDATEKVEFPMEEEMVDAEPMMYTTEEEIFEEEEKEENTVQLVSCMVSKAIAAALLAEKADITNNDVEEMMVDEEENQPAADHPALVQNDGCVPPSTSQKTKKSVRFTATAAGTPEGAACDVTGGLPFDLNMANSDGIDGAAIVVDDNTVAFAQWAGLATAGEEMLSPAALTKQATTPAAKAPDTLLKAKAQVSKFVSEAIAAAVDAATAATATTPIDAGRRQSSAPDTLLKAKAQVSKFVAEAIAAAVDAAASPAAPASVARRQSVAPDTLIKAKAQVSKFVADAIAAATANSPAAITAPDTLMKAKAEVSKFVSEAIAAATALAVSPAPASIGRRQSVAPDTLLKAKAQVAQFVSEAIEAAVAGCASPRTGALAAKLTELEEEHDITFELPADFMRWTPGPATSKKLLSISVAVNPRGEDAVVAPAAAATTPAPAARTSLAPQQLAAKLAELEQEHDITFELPVDFMRWTPAPATAGKKTIAVGVTPRSAAAAAKAATPAKAGMTPAGPGAQAPAPTPNTALTANKSAAVSKRKMTLDPTSLAAKLSELAEEHDVDFELPADFMRWTPAAKRAFSIAVTPRAANAPASVAKSQRSAPRSAVRAPAVTPAKGMTPAGPGAQAPAHTPATAARSTGKMMPGAAAGGLQVDTNALAAKLAQLAEQHDITFELPADFMRWTPAPGNKTSGSVIIAPVSAMKSQQRSAGRSRMAQAVEENEAADFPEEVMQPVAEKNNTNNDEFAGFLAASLEAVASARKTTPMSKSAARRRSSIRTPGTKIAIIGKSTPRSAAPSSVKNIRTTAQKKQQQQYQEEDAEMGEAAEVAPPAAGTIEKEVSGETLEKKIIESEIAVTNATTDASVEEMAQEAEEEPVADAEEQAEEEDEDFDFVEEQGAEEEAAGMRRVAFVEMADYRRAVIQLRIHRSRATGLATQLRGVSARALRLKRAATGLAKALEEERAKREELQATLQRIVANREAEEEELLAEEDGMDCDVEEEASLASPVQVKVVVVGYNPAPQPCHTEMAGNVVVVRPTSNTNTTITPAKSPMKAVVGFAAGVVAKTPTAGNKTASKSKTPGTLKKTVSKTPAGGRVLDDVEVPSWVFDKESTGAPAVDVSAELAEVAAAEDAEARDEAALKKLQAEVAAQAEDAESEEDDEEEAEEADRCHKCNEGDEGDVLLLCDGCDNACHLSCCNPPLKRIPKGDWFCVDCKKAKKAEEAAAKKAPAAKSGKKRAAAEPAAVEEKKAAPARGKKAAAAEKPAAAGTKRGRGAAATNAEEDTAPAAKKTRGGRQAAAPASTEKPAAAKRTTRTRK